jgi:hypothetical protein
MCTVVVMVGMLQLHRERYKASTGACHSLESKFRVDLLDGYNSTLAVLASDICT